MKGFLSIFAALMLLLGGAGLASADYLAQITPSTSHYIIAGDEIYGYQYSPTYNINYATKVIAGGYTSTDSSWDGNSFSSYIDGSVQPPTGPSIATWILGSPDFNYGVDYSGTYEMFGGAAGMSPKGSYTSTSWFTLGFDTALLNQSGSDLVVTLVGGWHPNATMSIYVSTDATYSETMTWSLLGALTSPGSKPSGGYGTAAAQYFDFADAGITDDVYYVKFVGYGYWIDSVGGNAAVPIPGAVYLLGSGLFGVFGLGRRYFKRA